MLNDFGKLFMIRLTDIYIQIFRILIGEKLLHTRFMFINLLETKKDMKLPEKNQTIFPKNIFAFKSFEEIVEDLNS